MPKPPPPLPPHLRNPHPVQKRKAWYKDWKVYLGIFGVLIILSVIGGIAGGTSEENEPIADQSAPVEDAAEPFEPVTASIGEKVVVDGSGYKLDSVEVIVDTETFSDPRKMLLCTFSFFNESSVDKEFSSMNLYLCDSKGNISGYEFTLDGFTTFPDTDVTVAPGETLTGNIVYMFEEDKAPFTLEVYNSYDGELVAIFDIPENLTDVEFPSEEDQEIEQENNDEPDLINFVINSTNGLIHKDGSYDAQRLLESGNGYLVQVERLSELEGADFVLCGNCFR